MNFEITYKGQLRCEAQHIYSGTLIETDAPIDNKGKGERFSPTDLVVNALATCILTTIAIKEEQLGYDMIGTKVYATKIMEDNPRRIGKITLDFLFPATLDNSEKNVAIIQRIAHACPVHHSLNPNIQVAVDFKWAAK
ncbi:MAG: OsmC family protein [Alphaproteobacteria bacterium]|nr:OsmC family protein [Alphaproteobacteria bacterium]